MVHCGLVVHSILLNLKASSVVLALLSERLNAVCSTTVIRKLKLTTTATLSRTPVNNNAKERNNEPARAKLK